MDTTTLVTVVLLLLVVLAAGRRTTEPPTAITVIPAQPSASQGAGCADAMLAGLLILFVLLLVGRIQ